jgi:hypothetical protein
MTQLKERENLVGLNDNDAKKLIRFNLIMGFVHFIQGVLMLMLSNNFTLPILTNYLNYNATTKTATPVAENLLNLKIGPAVSVFLFMSAAAHFILTLPKIRQWYILNLKQHRNYARWIEYAFSSSVMIVIIAMLCGIYDVGTLIALFGLNALMNFFGLLMERNYSNYGQKDWLSFYLGCLAGIIPWVIITIYFLGAAAAANGAIPNFVYAILGSLFVTFNIFALNMYLQYKGIGKWKNYIFGEKIFIILSLVAKSLLAWQVFSGTLR